MRQRYFICFKACLPAGFCRWLTFQTRLKWSEEWRGGVECRLVSRSLILAPGSLYCAAPESESSLSSASGYVGRGLNSDMWRQQLLPDLLIIRSFKRQCVSGARLPSRSASTDDRCFRTAGRTQPADKRHYSATGGLSEVASAREISPGLWRISNLHPLSSTGRNFDRGPAEPDRVSGRRQ